ncbi:MULTISPECIES: hypothetical protein [Paraburkholderia]|uniref:hypothetical protein n=1 Tax=Paraburkholderia TaxID=1822464 RepID=UPI0032187C5F
MCSEIMPLNEKIVRDLLDNPPANVGIWLQRDGCVIFTGIARRSHIDLLQRGARIFLKASEEVQTVVLDPTRNADSKGRKAVFFHFPLGWLGYDLQRVFNNNVAWRSGRPDHWTSIDDTQC